MTEDAGPVSAGDWRALLRRHRIRPDKGLGQNFLFDRGALMKILGAAAIEPSETVLEIGAGVGSLTRLLADHSKQVVAVELDRRLLPALREVVGDRTNVRVVVGDILELPLAELVGSAPYSVVANIPYHITSHLIRKLMEADPGPKKVVLTVQKEVAERVVATPGAMNLLALGVQVYGTPSAVATLPAGAFSPSPEVDSAVLRIDRHPRKLAEPAELDRLFELARAAFAQRRKQLKNSLSHGLAMGKGQVAGRLREAAVDPSRRPQSLALDDWIRLARAFADRGAEQGAGAG